MIVVLFDQTCFRNLSFLLSYKHLNEIKVLFVTFFVRMFWKKQDQAFNVKGIEHLYNTYENVRLNRFFTKSTKAIAFFETMRCEIPFVVFTACYSRSSCWQMFCKIRVLKNFAKFIRKHLCWDHFLIKFQVWRPATFPSLKGCNFIKKRLQHSWLRVNFAKSLRTPPDDTFCYSA